MKKRRPPRQKATKPRDGRTIIQASFDLVCDMEHDLTAAGDFADAIAVLAETAGESDGRVFQRLAWTLKDHCNELEKRRENLCALLHPNRATFEKIGWPDDAPPGAYAARDGRATRQPSS
jgi:hypothetical protein